MKRLRRLGVEAAAVGAAVGLLACGVDGSVIDPFAESATEGGLTSGGGTTTTTADSSSPTTTAATISGSATESPTSDPSVGSLEGSDSGSSGMAVTTSPDSSESGAESSSSGGPAPECRTDQDCDAGSICDNEICVPGCNGMQACADGFDCCDGQCFDLQTDFAHCGVCDRLCDSPQNIDSSCTAGECVLGDCDDGWFDCDGQGATGCESSEQCTCMPNSMQSCYPGPMGTEGVGICAAGTQQCNAAGTGWGACVNFTLPMAAEICGNGMDDNCVDGVDENPDIDGDGWGVCDNDCCETTDQCSDPALVNPGAFEFVGNMVDDDCDPLSSDVVAAPACSTTSDFTTVTGDQLAEAMDLCQFTTLGEPLPTRKWGVISAELLTPSGAVPVAAQLNDMQNGGTAVLTDYGTGGVVPQLNGTMAGLSSGMMRDQNDPGYVDPNLGVEFGWDDTPPAAYLAANGGALPSSASCNGACPAGAGANDGVLLRLTIRVPTNAQSFAYSFRFFSSEYWQYSCTVFNDFYLALLTTGAAGIPADGNISFDSLTNPVSVNNGFFEVCQARGCYTCPNGQGELAGTGMQLQDPFDPGGATGGGTVWLQTTAPIVPGEIMTLDLMIFDVSDNILDSLVLLDDFVWDIDPSDVGTNPQD